MTHVMVGDPACVDGTMVLRCPWPSLLHRDVDAAADHSATWLTAHDIISEHVRRQWASYRLEAYSARIAPTISRDSLFLLNDWVCWGTAVDDDCEVDDPSEIVDLIAQLCAVVTDEPRTIQAYQSPLVAALHDLWARTVAYGDTEQRTLLADRVVGWLQTYLLDAVHRRDHVPFGAERYLDHRKWTSALPLYMQLTSLFDGSAITAAESWTPLTAAVNRAVLQHVCIVNDIYSADREQSRSDPHNLVLTLQRAHGLSRQDAVADAVQIANELIDFVTALQPQFPHPEMLPGLWAWMRGNLDWSIETGRYVRHGPTEHP